MKDGKEDSGKQVAQARQEPICPSRTQTMVRSILYNTMSGSPAGLLRSKQSRYGLEPTRPSVSILHPRIQVRPCQSEILIHG